MSRDTTLLLIIMSINKIITHAVGILQHTLVYSVDK